MDIIFINNSKSLGKVEIKEYSSNPGIGGTEYVTLKIIFELSRLQKNNKFFIASEQNLISKKIKIISEKIIKSNSIIVCPISQIDYLNKINYKNSRVIYWSHHPHDNIKNYKNFIGEFISLGEYQYVSNKKLGIKNYLIKNPFPKPIPRKDLKRLTRKNPQNFVYIGAIGPAKGLHLILDYWPKIRNKFKNSKLNIIGGDLYRELKKESNKKLFTKSYERIIKNKLNKMSIEDKKSINFLGLLSSEQKDKILKDSDIALLNPTGKSEAAPASPLECYCYGIPVIAGGDFGAYDNMQFFPELDIKKNNINNIINTILNDNRYSLIKKRTYNLAKKNFKLNKKIYSDWEKLFSSKLKINKVKLSRYLTWKIKFRDFYYRKVKYQLKKILSLKN